MIQLNRPPEPDYLMDNKAQWGTALTSAIEQYGCYGDIPKDENKQLAGHYRHNKINALFPVK
jgi:hypothetical protein